MKTIAFYLPQYHEIEENNVVWGEGFTEWTNVKKSKPIIKNQLQPKVPLNENYYNLLDNSTREWQASLAKQYGIYGFCYYHYWFNGKLLLEKPAELMLADKNISTNFCFSWANEPWSKNWTGENKKVFVEQEYGEEKDWVKHFNYLLPFFKDSRYIKDNGKPMFILYKPNIIPNCRLMMECWEGLAKSNGFPGIFFGFQFPDGFSKKENEELFDFGIEFEPLYTRTEEIGFSKLTNHKEFFQNFNRYPRAVSSAVINKIKKMLLAKPTVYDYKKTCELLTHRKPKFSNSVPGMFTGWDKTPRNGKKATVYTNSTPELFEKYIRNQYKRAEEVYQTDYLFITAWNEWGEGAYLEPDTTYNHRYLESIINAQNNGESE